MVGRSKRSSSICLTGFILRFFSVVSIVGCKTSAVSETQSTTTRFPMDDR